MFRIAPSNVLLCITLPHVESYSWHEYPPYVTPIHDYLERHCEQCGAPLDEDQADMISDLEALRWGEEYMADWAENVCETCYGQRIRGDASSWLKELPTVRRAHPAPRWI